MRNTMTEQSTNKRDGVHKLANQGQVKTITTVNEENQKEAKR